MTSRGSTIASEGEKAPWRCPPSDMAGLLLYSILVLSPAFTLKDLTFLNVFVKRSCKVKWAFQSPTPLLPVMRAREREENTVLRCLHRAAQGSVPAGRPRRNTSVRSDGHTGIRVAASGQQSTGHRVPSSLPELSRPA